MSTIRKATTGLVKATDDPMMLDIIGSTEQVDRDGDIVRLEGWDLESYRKNPVFMWAHNYTLPPLGKAVQVVKDFEAGRLLFRIKFSEHNPMAVMVSKMYKEGVLNATSVGFAPIKPPKPREKSADDPMTAVMGKEYNGQELLELSAVPIPSNPGALQLALTKGFATKDALLNMGFPESFFDVVMKPMPKPGDDEKENDFISRCMSDDHMMEKYPEQDQRLAVCYSQLEGKGVNPIIILLKKVARLEEKIIAMEKSGVVLPPDGSLESGVTTPTDSEDGGIDPVVAHILDMAQRAKALNQSSLADDARRLAQQLILTKEHDDGKRK